jgi:uncharacterized membrane protein YphA (DoxX/SURF4 family)
VASRLPWIGTAARVAAGAIWLVAGSAKALDFASFETQVRAYDVLPGGLVAWVAYGLPLFEIGLGAYLVAGLLIRPAAVVSCVLIAGFIAVQAQAWARGLVVDCGCFGSLARERVGPLSVGRDVLLAVPSVMALVLPARRLSLDALRDRRQ